MRLFLLTVAALLAVAYAEKKVVCYYGSWAGYRNGDGKFEPSNIDPKLCTHLIYTFVGVDPAGQVIHLDAWNDVADGGGKDYMNKFNQLRQQSPDTKTLVAVGGWNEGCKNFSPMAANPTARKRFVESVVAFVKKHGFDGFDVDWEYPASNIQPGCSPADKQNFVALLKELRESFDKEGLLLSAAVAAPESTASTAYDIAEISKYLDFINLMAYDFHVAGGGKTGMNAPLYPSSSDTGAEAKLNIDAVIKYWLAQGAPAEKIVLGVPFYGRTFGLSNPQSHHVGAPVNRAAPAGPYTQEPGNLGYNEICEKFLTEKWDVKFDDEQKVPYAVNGDQWISFDNEQSLKEKTDYIKELGLGGAMVWSIETDDFLGKCGKKFPLLNTLNDELRNGASSSSPKSQPKAKRPTQSKSQPKEAFHQPQHQQPQQQQPQYQAPQQPQYQPPQQQQNTPSKTGDVCKTEGYVRDPKDCSKFYYCQYYNGQFNPLPLECPQTLVYDVSAGVCNFASAVQC